MSQRAWPWHRWGLIPTIVAAGVFFVIGGVGGWFLTSDTTSSSTSTETGTSAPAETISVAIPDKGEQLSPATNDHPAKFGYKDSIAIPDAVFDKLATMLRAPPPSWISTWGPPGSAILVALVALFGVLRSSHTTRISDARSEWFRRFKDMLDMALNTDNAHSEVGIKMLALHVKSDLAGDEEKELAATVYEDVLREKRAEAAKAAEAGDDVRFVMADDPPKGS